MKFSFFSAGLVAVFFVVIFSYTANAEKTPQWIESKGKSCPQVCLNVNQRPFKSGTYKNGNDFYVCAANACGAGFRAGYNVAGNARKCTVGCGGDEKSYINFRCLCY